MSLTINREFCYNKKGVLEIRTIYYNGSYYEKKIIPPIPVNEFLKIEKNRESDLYFPQAPQTHRFIESHVLPLSEEAINSVRYLFINQFN